MNETYLVDIPCKQGKIQVLQEGILRVQQPFNKTLWQIPCQSVLRFTTQPGSLVTVSIAIHTTQEIYYVDMVTKQNFEKLQAAFAELETTIVKGKEWYHDIRSLTHVEEYKDMKKLQKDVEEASKYGWVPQNTASRNGKFGVGKAIVGGALLGPVGLLAGAVGNKDKHTITFVRTPEWLAKNR